MENDKEADQLVHAIVDNWRTAPISEADKALCAYAEKLTLHPHKVQDEDLDELRSHAYDDRAIHDATQVIGYFNYITRIAGALGVEPESFIQPWGKERNRGRGKH